MFVLIVEKTELSKKVATMAHDHHWLVSTYCTWSWINRPASHQRHRVR